MRERERDREREGERERERESARAVIARERKRPARERTPKDYVPWEWFKGKTAGDPSSSIVHLFTLSGLELEPLHFGYGLELEPFAFRITRLMTNAIRKTTWRGPTGETLRKSRDVKEETRGRGEHEGGEAGRREGGREGERDGGWEEGEDGAEEGEGKEKGR